MALSGTERELIGTRWMIRTENAVTRATAEGVIGVASQRAREPSPPTGSRAPRRRVRLFLALERGAYAQKFLRASRAGAPFHRL
jgi:hypothetical protein